MSRLLLHVGLPKTATTTLQHNVLLRLHEAERINFLGRCAGRAGVFDPFGPLLDRIRTRRLTGDEIDALRPKAVALLDDVRLNVISNERVTSETVGRFAPGDAEAVLCNLRALFRNESVTVLVSLREPVDFAFALYVEMYYWQYHAEPDHYTLGRFLQRLIADGRRGENVAWLVLFPDAYLRAASRHFASVEVLLYEDLQHDRMHYFSQLAACLEADPVEIERLFSTTPRNVGAHTPAGKRSRPLPAPHVVEPHLAQRGWPWSRVLPKLRRSRWGMPWYDWLLQQEIAVEHRRPGDAMRARLLQALGVKDDYLTRTFGLGTEKLARYGYLRPAPARTVPPS